MTGRKLGVSDLMILVAATGLGLALARPYHAQSFGWGDAFRPDFQWICGWVAFRLPGFSAVLLAWSVGWLAIRLRSPRPGRRKLAREPGFVACSIAAFALISRAAIVLLGDSVVWVSDLRTDGSQPRFALEFVRDIRDPGFAVLAAWVLLAFSGRWRPGASAIDRLGQGLGAAWIASAAIFAFSEAIG